MAAKFKQRRDLLGKNRLTDLSFEQRPGVYLGYFLIRKEKFCLTAVQGASTRGLMNTIHAKPAVRIFLAMLVTVTIVGLSSLAMHASTQNQNPLAPSLKSIQTDEAKSFYAGAVPSQCWFRESVLPGTSESKAATENLKVITAAL